MDSQPCSQQASLLVNLARPPLFSLHHNLLFPLPLNPRPFHHHNLRHNLPPDLQVNLLLSLPGGRQANHQVSRQDSPLANLACSRQDSRHLSQLIPRPSQLPIQLLLHLSLPLTQLILLDSHPGNRLPSLLPSPHPILPRYKSLFPIAAFKKQFRYF